MYIYRLIMSELNMEINTIKKYQKLMNQYLEEEYLPFIKNEKS